MRLPVLSVMESIGENPMRFQMDVHLMCRSLSIGACVVTHISEYDDCPTRSTYTSGVVADTRWDPEICDIAMGRSLVVVCHWIQSDAFCKSCLLQTSPAGGSDS